MGDGFEIEKGIPIPPTYSGTRTRYPWDGMEVGDSFFIPCEDGDRGLHSARATSAGIRFGRRHTPRRKFSVRQIEGGVRVWRVE